MSSIIIDKIPFKVNDADLLHNLKIEPDSEDADFILEMARHAEKIAIPKVLYREAFIDSKMEDHIVVEGVELKSRILSMNTENVYRVFPYVATCGVELHEWAYEIDDILYKYWAEAICVMALNTAVATFKEHLNKAFNPGKTSSMNPGSLSDWPINQQVQLFKVLGSPEKEIGVKLTESFLMIPFKSVSGVRFCSDADFKNCKLCGRENCPGRRAVFEEKFANKYKAGR